jgi:hypothetical protein
LPFSPQENLLLLLQTASLLSATPSPPVPQLVQSGATAHRTALTRRKGDLDTVLDRLSPCASGSHFLSGLGVSPLTSDRHHEQAVQNHRTQVVSGMSHHWTKLQLILFFS